MVSKVNICSFQSPVSQIKEKQILGPEIIILMPMQ